MTTDTKPTFDQLLDQIAQGSPGDDYTKGPYNRFVYTSGVQLLARNAECFWLLDAIASHLPSVANIARRDPRLADFQIWTLTVRMETIDGCNATLIGFADTDEKGRPDGTAARQTLWTDFPVTTTSEPDHLKLYLEQGSYLNDNGDIVPTWVLMLPSER